MKRLILLILFFKCPGILRAQVIDSVLLPNASLYYEIKGEGLPILLLSGGPGISPAQLSSLRDTLSQKYKCILFDQRGTGQSHTSPLDSTTINLKQGVQDISSLLRVLKIERVTIIGHSWGAMLAVNFAIDHPAQINKLVLIGSGPLAYSDYYLLEDNIYARASRSENEYMERLQDSMTRAASPAETIMYRRKFAKQFLRLLSYDAMKVDAIFEEVGKSRTNPQMQFLMLQDLRKINYNVKDKVALLNVPTLVICGRQDPVGLFPSIQLKELNQKFKLAWIEKSGHYPWLENHLSFYREVFKFLQ